jgi:hypothetical protein
MATYEAGQDDHLTSRVFTYHQTVRSEGIWLWNREPVGVRQGLLCWGNRYVSCRLAPSHVLGVPPELLHGCVPEEVEVWVNDRLIARNPLLWEEMRWEHRIVAASPDAPSTRSARCRISAHFSPDGVVAIHNTDTVALARERNAAVSYLWPLALVADIVLIAFIICP